MDTYAALILAKNDSKRLEGKNTKDFGGVPMFMINVNKCLDIFEDVYVSSNDTEILNNAAMVGAKTIWRDDSLCGDTPNIPVYQHALKEMPLYVGGVVAVQACSPTIELELIQSAKDLMEYGYQELMTCHPLSKGLSYHDQAAPLYGSIWAISRDRLENYGDPFKPNPEVLLVDPSVDIHTYADYKKALRIWQRLTQAS